MRLVRSQELGRITAALDRARAGRACGMLLVGEVGSGRTTLLDAACAEFVDGTVIRLRAAPAEAEMDLAGLVDLLTQVAAHIPSLGDPASAVLGDLLAAGAPATAVQTSTAALTLCAHLATRAPVLIAVDDAQWLDAATASAFAYVLRRLGPAPVALVMTATPDHHLDTAGMEVVTLGDLDRAASTALLADVTDMDAHVALACHLRCGGNPAALVALATGLTPDQRFGRSPLPDRLPLDPTQSAALEHRFDRLTGAQDRQALRLIALAVTFDGTMAGSASSQGDLVPIGTVRSGLGSLGIGADALDRAIDAGILRRVGAEIGFTHPLLREAAAHGPRAERVAAHAALADLTEGVVRAWHLAEADQEDTALALASAAAAEIAGSGDLRRAAAIWERAAGLARDTPTRVDLLLAAGRAWNAETAPSRALPLLRVALRLANTPELRAEVALVLVDVMAWAESVEEAVSVAIWEAGRIENSSADLAASLLGQACVITCLGGDLRRAVDLAVRAEEVAARAEAEEIRLAVGVIGMNARLLRGAEAGPVDADRIAAWAAMVDTRANPQVLELGQLIAFDLGCLERWEVAAAAFSRIAARAGVLGLQGVRAFALAMRADLMWRAGRWGEARSESTIEVGQHRAVEEGTGSFGHAVAARVDAALGLGVASRRTADLAREVGRRRGLEVLTAWAEHARGFLALAEDRLADAHDALAWVWRLSRRGGIEHPGALWWQGDLLEVLHVTGRGAEIDRLREQLQTQAEATGLLWPTAIVARADALRTRDAARAATSVELLDSLGAPFEAARSRLVLAGLTEGATRRSALEEALDVCERLGAQRWIRLCRAGLGEAAPVVQPSELDAVLSEAELRVALAVARGLTNREAAVELSLSPKTVDRHLQAIYRKLDLRSRTELALAVSRSGTHSPPPPARPAG